MADSAHHYRLGSTAMITLGMYHIGDAYYWRAWNRYQVHDLPNAWTDVEEARKLKQQGPGAFLPTDRNGRDETVEQRRQIGVGMALGVPPRILAVRPLLVALAVLLVLGGLPAVASRAGPEGRQWCRPVARPA